MCERRLFSYPYWGGGLSSPKPLCASQDFRSPLVHLGRTRMHQRINSAKWKYSKAFIWMVTHYRVSLEDQNMKTRRLQGWNHFAQDGKKNTNQMNVLFKSFQLYGYTRLVYAQIRNIHLNILRWDLTRGVRGENKVVETKSWKKPSGLMMAGKHKAGDHAC